jgi:peptidoglycan/xylan/chitin deacetylase (PgdA/CDA1 family)
VLAYHSVGSWQWGVNDVPPLRFRQQMLTALALGYRFAPSSSVADAVDGAPPLLAVTFDDGLRSVLDHAAPVLCDLGIPWTVFVVTSWVDGRHPTAAELMLTWTDLERVIAMGGRVGSHSVSHADFGRLSPAEAEDELGRSREAIRRRLGATVREFAIPFGLSRNWSPAAATAAAAVGYTHVYAQSEDRRPARTIARTFISRHDSQRVFRAALSGAFRRWEERA